MKIRIITGLALIFIVVPLLFLGNTYFNALITLVLIAAGYELVHILPDKERKIYLYLVSISFLVINHFVYANHMIVGSFSILVLLVILITISIVDKDIRLDTISYLFLFMVLIVQGLHTLTFIQRHLGNNYIILLAISTYGCDTFAYFGGKFFGKHKLIPHLSPNKTIEGSISGVVVGMLMATTFGYVTNIIPGHETLIIAIFVLTITGQIGDLIFSSAKRRFDVKDYSNLLPGHGGILDRIDSLVLNALVLSLFIMKL